MLSSVNSVIQKGETSYPYALSVRRREGVRFVVIGYFQGEQFLKVVIAAGFADGVCEGEIAENLINWFTSTRSPVRLPVSVSCDGALGAVGRYVLDCATAEGRPILESNLLDLAWLVDTLRRSFSSGVQTNPWGFLENLRARAGGMYNSELLHSLPMLGKVIIILFQFSLFVSAHFSISLFHSA